MVELFNYYLIFYNNKLMKMLVFSFSAFRDTQRVKLHSSYREKVETIKCHRSPKRNMLKHLLQNANY
jgi:hypothetical protein